MATVKRTVSGFTNGDMYFGRDNAIGWLSAEGTRSNLNWCTLTNDVVTNALYLRGSLYVDQTGVWSNNLIAVTSDSMPESGKKGVWKISSQGQPTLIANVETLHLEGVVTVTNDSQRWGPWAGCIITGDENQHLLYTIDTNAVTASHALGVSPEDFDIIPPGQDLYCVNFRGADSIILKLSRDFLTNYVGDLLITDAGEFSLRARLFIVHWNATDLDFTLRSISLPDEFAGDFEHVTFAPVNLPSLVP